MAQVAGGFLGVIEFIAFILIVLFIGARLEAHKLMEQEHDKLLMAQRKQQQKKPPEPVMSVEPDNTTNGHVTVELESW